MANVKLKCKQLQLFTHYTDKKDDKQERCNKCKESKLYICDSSIIVLTQADSNLAASVKTFVSKIR